MERKKYFISADLEDTLYRISNKSKDRNTNILKDIRKEIKNVLNESFNYKVDIEYISYNEIKNFYLDVLERLGEGIVINLLGGIYLTERDIKNKNININLINLNITRIYNSYENVIIGGNYSYSDRFILKPLKSIINDIYINIKTANFEKNNIYILDDGLFSGGTINKIISFLQEKYKKEIKIKGIITFFNFSGKKDLNGIPIISKINLSPDKLIDWLDERDLFLGVYLYGASFVEDKKISGIPYFWNSRIANIKASIPKESANEFVKKMYKINEELWKTLGGNNISSYSRNYWLEKKYGKNIDIVDILKK